MKTTLETPRAAASAQATRNAAFAQIGENGREFANQMLAKFRPGGANRRRLRAMQDVGEALENNPGLFASAPAMRADLDTANALVTSLTADVERLRAAARLFLTFSAQSIPASAERMILNGHMESARAALDQTETEAAR